MTVTLYRPSLAPEAVSEAGFRLDENTGQVIQDTGLAAGLLGCAPFLVDVLANGKGYLLYSVFDYEGEANTTAMAVFTKLTGIELNPEDDDGLLQGPVLVIQY